MRYFPLTLKFVSYISARIVDDMFDDLGNNFSDLFSSLVYFVKVSQVKKLIYILIRKKRGKILGDKRQELFEQVKNISKGIYNNYSGKAEFIKMNYFPYCRLIRNFSNYHFLFLVIRNKYKIF